MSILIKDMEIPKNCVECKLSDHISPTECPIYSIEKGDYWDKRYKYCPLVEVPPRGDLVDLNDMVHPNDSMRRMTIDEQLRRTCEGWSADRKQYVVIEAEGSDT